LVVGLTLLGSTASAHSAQSSEALQDWPSRPVTIIAGNRVGGVFDTMARGLAKHLAPVLGVPVVVQNISGSTTKAASYLLRQPNDGYTYLVTAPAPFMVWSMANKDVDFTLDDFALINNQWNSMAGLMLNNDRDYPDVETLFEAIREHPLKLAAAVLPRSGGQINVLLTLEALGIPVENLRMVYYSSGSQLRTAVAGGGLRPVADVPSINQMLERRGKSVDFVPSSLKSVMASKTFKNKHPERFNKIVAAFKQVVDSKAFKDSMSQQLVGHTWQGPQQSTLEMRQAYDLFVGYNPLIKKYE